MSIVMTMLACPMRSCTTFPGRPRSDAPACVEMPETMQASVNCGTPAAFDAGMMDAFTRLECSTTLPCRCEDQFARDFNFHSLNALATKFPKGTVRSLASDSVVRSQCSSQPAASHVARSS